MEASPHIGVQKGTFSLVSHLFPFFIHSTDADGTHVHAEFPTTVADFAGLLPPKRSNDCVWVILPIHARPPRIGAQLDEQKHFVVAWADTQNSFAAQGDHGPISSIPPCRGTRNFTEEANALNCWNILAEQHVHWQQRSRNTLNFPQASFERAVQECEQATRDEVHVAVAQSTERPDAEMRKRMGALENQAEQTCTSHQITSSSEMNGVASIRTGKPEKKFGSMKQRRNGKKASKAKSRSEVQQGVQVQHVANGEEVEIFRHELSQYLAERSHSKNLYTTSRYGASEYSSEVQHLRHDREHLTGRSRNLETKNTKMSKCSQIFRSASSANSSIERNGRCRKTKIDNTTGRRSSQWSRESKSLSNC